MPKNNTIYLDHAATTPVDPAVVKAMQPYQTEVFGNASSVHAFGQQAMRAVDTARTQVGQLLNCSPHDIVFTSGATESNNLALFGLLEPGQHLITTAIEHPAILEPAQELENRGVKVTYIKPNNLGLINADQVLDAITAATRLISIQYVNNEIGTIQPIAQIGRQLKQLDKKIYFHTDAVQAASTCSLDVKELGVDLMSLSAHKMYGPKGVGVLFHGKGIDFKPLQFGGHHEYGIRPGTLNVVGIVGMGQAAELCIEKASLVGHIRQLRDALLSAITSAEPAAIVNGELTNRVAGNVHFSFPGISGENLLLLLDQHGIAASIGPACASGSNQPSHVLKAIGLQPDLIDSSLRLTLGRGNTKKQIAYVIKKLPQLLDQLR